MLPVGREREREIGVCKIPGNRPDRPEPDRNRPEPAVLEGTDLVPGSNLWEPVGTGPVPGSMVGSARLPTRTGPEPF